MKLNSLKFLSATLLAATLGLSSLIAQDGPPPKDGGPRGPGRQSLAERMEQLSKELELTDAQKAQLKPIIEAELKAMKELMDNKELSREDRREKMQAIRKEGRTKIEAVLTKEQVEKLNKIQAERGPGRPRGEKKE